MFCVGLVVVGGLGVISGDMSIARMIAAPPVKELFCSVLRIVRQDVGRPKRDPLSRSGGHCVLSVEERRRRGQILFCRRRSRK